MLQEPYILSTSVFPSLQHDGKKSASQERDKATYVILMHATSIVARLPQTKIQEAPDVGEEWI